MTQLQQQPTLTDITIPNWKGLTFDQLKVGMVIRQVAPGHLKDPLLERILSIHEAELEHGPYWLQEASLDHFQENKFFLLADIRLSPQETEQLVKEIFEQKTTSASIYNKRTGESRRVHLRRFYVPQCIKWMDHICGNIEPVMLWTMNHDDEKAELWKHTFNQVEKSCYLDEGEFAVTEHWEEVEAPKEQLELF